MAGSAPAWEAKLNPQVPRGQASLPPTWWASGARSGYVLLTVGGKSNQFVATQREGATGYQAQVSDASLGLQTATATPCTVTELTSGQYRRRALVSTPAGRATIFGLVVATVGVAIDTSLKVGAKMTPPLIEISMGRYGALLVVAGALQIVGLLIAFYKGFLKPD